MSQHRWAGEYFERALKLPWPGSLIVVDNVVRDGVVIDASSRDASVQGEVARRRSAARGRYGDPDRGKQGV